MDTTGIISIRMASKSLPATTIEYKHNANHQRRASSRGEDEEWKLRPNGTIRRVRHTIVPGNPGSTFMSKVQADIQKYL
jgi:hypothetical protein